MMHQAARSPGARSCDPALLLAFLLPVFAWAPLTYPGYFVFRNGFLPVFNLADFLAHLGDWRWTPVIGRGHDLLRGEHVLPYLLGALPTMLGATPAAATKLVFGLSLLAASMGMFGWARRRLGDWPALVATMAYICSPIALVTIFGRGALGEAVLLGLAPCILWAADASLSGARLAAIGLVAGVAAALWTQAGLALWLLAVLLAHILTIIPGDAAHGVRRMQTAAALMVGLVIGILGLLPAFLGKGLGGATPVDFLGQFMGLHEILGMSGRSMAPGLGLGVIAIGLALFAFLAPSPRPLSQDSLEVTRVSELRRTRNFALVVVILLVFLSVSLSAPLWRGLPFLARSLTYPWQLLLLAGPWLAWLAGLGARRLGVLFSPSVQMAAMAPLFAGVLTLVVLEAYVDLRPLTTTEPADRAPLAIYGDNEIALLSVETEGVPVPGGRVALEAHWQALRPLAHDYTVFFHVVAADEQRYAQHDGMPQDAQLPTTHWLPGEIVVDRYAAVLSPDAPRGSDYRYWLGWYLGETGERLVVGEYDKYVVTP